MAPPTRMKATKAKAKPPKAEAREMDVQLSHGLQPTSVLAPFVAMPFAPSSVLAPSSELFFGPSGLTVLKKACMKNSGDTSVWTGIQFRNR